jgi:putative ABC transport system ATP-binding protein
MSGVPDGSLLQLDEVSRIYGDEIKVHALDRVSMSIEAGEYVSIVGPSGSGKSTMLGLLGLLDLPSLGTMWVTGKSVRDLSDYERSRLRGDVVGFIFQQFHLIPHLDARRNVETALLYRNLSPTERRRRAMEALDVVGLAPRSGHRPVQLSGGEQQRVAIARAIVTEPKLLLADEPTGALDSTNAANVMEIFQDLHSPLRAIAIVTHDPAVAATAQRRISMKDGRIVADEILNPRKPADGYGGTLGTDGQGTLEAVESAEGNG